MLFNFVCVGGLLLLRLVFVLMLANCYFSSYYCCLNFSYSIILSYHQYYSICYSMHLIILSSKSFVTAYSVTVYFLSISFISSLTSSMHSLQTIFCYSNLLNYQHYSSYHHMILQSDTMKTYMLSTVSISS